MADNWQQGDLALCIKVGSWSEVGPSGVSGFGPGPTAGSVNTVIWADVCPFDGHTYLFFEPWPRAGFLACRFCKIRPHAPDTEDAETIRLMNGTPVREPVA